MKTQGKHRIVVDLYPYSRPHRLERVGLQDAETTRVLSVPFEVNLSEAIVAQVVQFQKELYAALRQLDYPDIDVLILPPRSIDVALITPIIRQYQPRWPCIVHYGLDVQLEDIEQLLATA